MDPEVPKDIVLNVSGVRTSGWKELNRGCIGIPVGNDWNGTLELLAVLMRLILVGPQQILVARLWSGSNVFRASSFPYRWKQRHLGRNSHTANTKCPLGLWQQRLDPASLELHFIYIAAWRKHWCSINAHWMNEWMNETWTDNFLSDFSEVLASLHLQIFQCLSRSHS